MKCTNCGGELNFEGGIGICSSCGSKHKLDNIFEKIDVCLCYIEYDNAGRRTKDSIIAQEVYSKLENKKINVFYERISANNCLPNELELLRQVAISNANIVIVIGASKENFETLTQKYSEHFNGKHIIPFFADINPNDIPHTLNKLQALNYGKIGWEKDLVTGTLNILGRNDEANIEDIYTRSRKKKLIFVLTCISVCVILIGALIFALLNNGNKQDSNQPLTKLQMYENAADLTEQGELLEAAEIYSQILDFKDSQQLLDKVYSQYYSKYSGTYLTDDKKTMLTLEIKNNTSVQVVYKHNKDGDRRHYSATTTANIHTIEFDGIGKIELLDNKIKFSLEYANDPTLNISLEFTFEQKGDPIEYDSGVREELLSFFNPDIYPVDYGVPFVDRETIFSLGYTLTSEGMEGLINNVVNKDYATKNTYESNLVGEIVTPNGSDSYYDYESLKRYHGASYYDYQYNEENDIIFEFDASGNYSQVHNVLSIFGRASLLTPDKIGKKPTDFTENGVVYSYIDVGDVLQKDDWVNITSYNPDYLKEYNEKMKLVKKINATDFSNPESVFALNEYDLTESDFMLSDYKLGFYYYTNNLNGFMNHEVYEIIGTDYQVLFYFYKNGELVKSEIYPKGERIKPEVLTYR